MTRLMTQAEYQERLRALRDDPAFINVCGGGGGGAFKLVTDPTMPLGTFRIEQTAELVRYFDGDGIVTLHPDNVLWRDVVLAPDSAFPTAKQLNGFRCSTPGFLAVTGEGVVVDPLDIKYDDVMLRDLLVCDRWIRREVTLRALTPAQRAAVSAHWSAELRAKIQAAAEAVRLQVKVAVDDLG